MIYQLSRCTVCHIISPTIEFSKNLSDKDKIDVFDLIAQQKKSYGLFKIFGDQLRRAVSFPAALVLAIPENSFFTEPWL